MGVFSPKDLADPPLTGADGDPLAELRDGHARIRHFSTLALKLLDAREALGADVGAAAAALQRCFGLTVPEHDADEELSLAPRVVGWVPGTALAEMVSQHRQVRAALKEPLELWSLLVGEPEALPDVEGRLRPATLRMVALWEPHLSLEEDALFPEIERLPPSVKARIADEMRARRQA